MTFGLDEAELTSKVKNDVSIFLIRYLELTPTCIQNELPFTTSKQLPFTLMQLPFTITEQLPITYYPLPRCPLPIPHYPLQFSASMNAFLLYTEVKKIYISNENRY